MWTIQSEWFVAKHQLLKKFWIYKCFRINGLCNTVVQMVSMLAFYSRETRQGRYPDVTDQWKISYSETLIKWSTDSTRLHSPTVHPQGWQLSSAFKVPHSSVLSCSENLYIAETGHLQTKNQSIRHRDSRWLFKHTHHFWTVFVISWVQVHATLGSPQDGIGTVLGPF